MPQKNKPKPVIQKMPSDFQRAFFMHYSFILGAPLTCCFYQQHVNGGLSALAFRFVSLHKKLKQCFNPWRSIESLTIRSLRSLRFIEFKV